jgi:uncharacterized membrane protein
MAGAMVSGLLWLAAIGCGLMAGIYFAFSTFIVRALAGLGHAQGAAAMNAINADIVRSWFLPLFLGTTLASLALAGLGLFRIGTPGALAMAGGGLAYVFGMFLVTMVFSVPLNNALAAGATEPLWEQYVRQWMLWNHVRTFASTGACGLFILALTER